MADRELTFAELKKVFESHGCRFELNKRNYVKISLGDGPTFRGWIQHAHKGAKDRFSKEVVARARRKLGFAEMVDDEFYRAL